MTTRVIKVSESSFATLDFVVGVFGVLGFLSLAGIVLCFIGTLATLDQESIAAIFGFGIFACFGSALFCFVSQQALLLGRRAVIALESMSTAMRPSTRPTVAAPAATTAPLPPAP